MIGNDSDVSEGDVSEPGSVERSPLPSMDISLPATSTESSNLSSSMEDSDLQSLIDVETCRGRVKVRGQRGGSKRGRGRGRKWKRRGGRQGSRGSGGRSGIRGSSGQGSSYLSASTIAVLHEIGSVWKKEEPTSYTMPYTRTPGPTSPDVTSQSTPGDLFCHFFFRSSVGFDYGRDKSLCQFFYRQQPQYSCMDRYNCRGAKSFCWALDFDGYCQASSIRTVLVY